MCGSENINLSNINTTLTSIGLYANNEGRETEVLDWWAQAVTDFTPKCVRTTSKSALADDLLLWHNLHAKGHYFDEERLLTEIVPYHSDGKKILFIGSEKATQSARVGYGKIYKLYKRPISNFSMYFLHVQPESDASSIEMTARVLDEISACCSDFNTALVSSGVISIPLMIRLQQRYPAKNILGASQDAAYRLFGIVTQAYSHDAYEQQWPELNPAYFTAEASNTSRPAVTAQQWHKYWSKIPELHLHPTQITVALETTQNISRTQFAPLNFDEDDAVLYDFHREVTTKVIVRPQDKCNDETGPNNTLEPYVIVAGCGYSATGAVSRVLSTFGIPMSHETTDLPLLRTTGVSSWLSTVQPDVEEPQCRQLHLFVVIRHPLKVATSQIGSKWNFEWGSLKVQDWVGPRYAEIWKHLTDPVRSLLWWSAFCIIGESQIRPGGFAFSAERVFELHDGAPLRAVLEQSFQQKLDTAVEKIISDHLAKLKTYNTHRAEAKMLTWRSVLEEVERNRARDGERIFMLQKEAVRFSQRLCERYGYDGATGGTRSNAFLGDDGTGPGCQ